MEKEWKHKIEERNRPEQKPTTSALHMAARPEPVRSLHSMLDSRQEILLSEMLEVLPSHRALHVFQSIGPCTYFLVNLNLNTILLWANALELAHGLRG